MKSLSIGIALALAVAACGGGTAPDRGAPTGIVTLRADGIGVADIGQPPGAVLGELNTLLGEPNVDSGWIPPDSPLYGSCPGVTMRATGWGSLYAFFVAEAPVVDDDDPAARFYSYSYGYDFSRNEGATDPRGLGLATAEGIGLGTTRSELATRYGADAEFAYDAATDVYNWTATTPTGTLRGLLSGPEDDATVVLIETSPGCEIR